MSAFIVIGKVGLKIIYFFLKLLPVQNKILFLSRQSNNPTLDFKILKEAIENKNKEVKIVMICKRLEGEKDIKKNISVFAKDLLKSMYHLATSKVCAIDSYSIPVSILKHKKRLTIIQLWHAMGKIKQSGYQTVGKETGRSIKMVKLLNMHKNYDIVIAGAKAWNFAYCASFGIDESKIWNIGLPRAAYIYQNKKQIQNKIYKTYPELKTKKVILYSPTFRVNQKEHIQEIIENNDYDKYNLIITCHPKQLFDVSENKVYRCKEFNIFELLTICDYFITDYSSLAVEAAALSKKTYYYLYDYENYIETNGLNFDPLKELPTIAFRDGKKLMKTLLSDNYDMKTFINYRKKYVPKDFTLATDKLVDYILKKI